MSPADHNEPERGSDDLVAAEYVLGVLPADERQAAARRIDSDPAFARLVDSWELRLSPLAADYDEVEPPASVKRALDSALFPAEPARRVPAGGLWSSLALWRGLAVASLAALVVAVSVLMLGPLGGPQPEQRYVASLSHDDTDVHYFVVYDARENDVGLSHVTGARPEGRDFELWVIQDGTEPRSLGVIPVGSNVHLAVSEALRTAIDEGAVLAISTEPPGGSPSGAPTGPVVALGDLKTI